MDEKSLKKIQDRIRKHVRTVMRYNITDDVLGRLIQTALRNKKDENIDPISKEGFILQYITEFLKANFPRETWKEASAAVSHADPYQENSVKALLGPAISAMESLEAAGAGINAKIEIMQANANNPLFKDIFKYAYDITLVYSIGDSFKVDLVFPSTSKNSSRWPRFFDLLKRFACQPSTTAADRQELTEVLASIPRRARKWAERILRKDLKIGLGDSAIRKVWPGMLPVFNVSLCSTIKNGDTLQASLDALPDRLWVEPKYDGLRAVVIVQDAKKGAGKVFSRKGLPHSQLDYLIPEACKLVESGGLNVAVLDCEGVHAHSTRYSDAVSSLNTHDVEDRPLRLMVFDYIPPSDFSNGRSELTQEGRRAVLEGMFDQGGRHAPSFKLTPGNKIGRKERLERMQILYARWRKEGYEGVVIKDRDAPYASGERNRKKSGFSRIKPFETADVVITGSFTGKTGTKYDGILGGLTCALPDGTEIRVGGGFSDAQRKDFWDIRKKLVGRTIEIERQELHEGAGIAVRHPVFIRLREASDK